MNYTIEKHMRVYDNDSGEYIEIRPDGDGLGCVDIRQCDRQGKILARITTSRDMTILIHEAIGLWLNQSN